MIKILFIAPHSFPVHSSESIVNAKLAYSLAMKGHFVDVYSVENNGFSYPSADTIFNKQRVPSLNINIIKNIPLFSTKFGLKNLVKVLFAHLFVLIKRGFFYPDIIISEAIINKIKKGIRERGKFDYDIIISRGFYTELVGIYFAKKYNAKLISNWNDPYPLLKFPPPYGKGAEAKLPFFQKKLLKKIQQYSMLHTFPSERLRDYMLTYYTSTNINNTMIIPHMAHSQLLPLNKSEKSYDKLRIIHAGDISKPRDPGNFLQALSNLNKSNDNFCKTIEVLFVGKYNAELKQKIESLNLNNVVELLPATDYFKVIELICKSHVSIIIEAICNEGIYLPTKVVDAIQCAIPIFAISPNKGTLKDLIDTYKIGYFSHNESIFDIQEQIKNMINDFQNKNLPVIDHRKLSYFFEISILEQYDQIFSYLDTKSPIS